MICVDNVVDRAPAGWLASSIPSPAREARFSLLGEVIDMPTLRFGSAGRRRELRGARDAGFVVVRPQ